MSDNAKGNFRQVMTSSCRMFMTSLSLLLHHMLQLLLLSIIVAIRWLTAATPGFLIFFVDIFFIYKFLISSNFVVFLFCLLHFFLLIIYHNLQASIQSICCLFFFLSFSFSVFYQLPQTRNEFFINLIALTGAL